jgi:hypothetical protein
MDWRITWTRLPGVRVSEASPHRSPPRPPPPPLTLTLVLGLKGVMAKSQANLAVVEKVKPALPLPSIPHNPRAKTQALSPSMPEPRPLVSVRGGGILDLLPCQGPCSPLQHQCLPRGAIYFQPITAHEPAVVRLVGLPLVLPLCHNLAMSSTVAAVGHRRR